MTPTELRRLIKAAGLATQGEAAERIGVHRNTISRWLNRDTPIHQAAAALIRERLTTGKKR